MTPITTARLIVALIAAILLVYGMRMDDEAVRWAGIGFLVAALLMRFIRPRERP
ncbi:MAG: hypothetical protein M3O61_03150 [Gemmatimonadota bacterium]|nr:hypothetical protein [Gemmatimonadota bacterium]HYN81077.1 hypothetical protein [Gemmatimonadaceae bacterium]